MFKFLKTKKGFTLVELMIVVVIMAILVAVAVPIFSAVTKNAQKRTCAANQREIQGQFQTSSMNKILNVAEGDVFTLTSDSEGESADWEQTVGENADENEEVLKNLFNENPYCPLPGAVITVEVELVLREADSAFQFKTDCDQSGHVGYTS